MKMRQQETMTYFEKQKAMQKAQNTRSTDSLPGLESIATIERRSIQREQIRILKNGGKKARLRHLLHNSKTDTQQRLLNIKSIEGSVKKSNYYAGYNDDMGDILSYDTKYGVSLNALKK